MKGATVALKSVQSVNVLTTGKAIFTRTQSRTVAFLKKKTSGDQ